MTIVFYILLRLSTGHIAASEPRSLGRGLRGLYTIQVEVAYDSVWVFVPPVVTIYNHHSLTRADD